MNSKKGYLVGIMEKNKNDYNMKVINCVSYDLEMLIALTEKYIIDLWKELNEVDDSGVYIVFGGKFKEVDDNGVVAEYYIQEMRSKTIYVKYNIFELEV